MILVVCFSRFNIQTYAGGWGYFHTEVMLGVSGANLARSWVKLVHVTSKETSLYLHDANVSVAPAQGSRSRPISNPVSGDLVSEMCYMARVMGILPRASNDISMPASTLT